MKRQADVWDVLALPSLNRKATHMSKITLAYPIEKIQGKVNKTDSAYFSCRNGRTFMKRTVNPYKGDPTGHS